MRPLTIQKSLFLVLYLISVSHSKFVQHFDKSTFIVYPLNDTHVKLMAEVVQGTHLAVGIGTSMFDADTFVYQSFYEHSLQGDYWCNGYNEPEYDD